MIFIWRGLHFLTQSFEYDFKCCIHLNSLKIISMHQVTYVDASENYCCYGRSGNDNIYIELYDKSTSMHMCNYEVCSLGVTTTTTGCIV